MNDVIVGIDTEHDADETLATEMVFDLLKAYPGHPWHVTIRGGLVHVKNLNFPPNWGMAIHFCDIKTDAKHRKQKLIRSAGEFLERANLKRGAATGEAVKKVEGIPEKKRRTWPK